MLGVGDYNSINKKIRSRFTARCTLVQSAVLRSYVVRLSVRDQIRRNSSKIILRLLISLGC